MKQGKNNTNNNNNKKKRSRPQKKKKVNSSSVGFGGEEEKQEKDHYYEEESKILSTLMEAFPLTSLEEAASAYKEANHDPNRAAEILGLRLDNFTSSFCSSSEGYNMEANKDFRGGGGACNNNNKAKKVIASTGTVSSMLGKDYLKRKDTITINSKKGLNNMHLDKDGAEQFLCSMLGDECELSMAVVRDVFCQCGYNVEQALDALLDLAASYREQSYNRRFSRHSSNDNEDTGLSFDHSSSSTDMGLDSTSLSSENDFQDLRSMGNSTRNYFKVLATSDAHSPTSERAPESDLPQAVLESLFNVSQSPEHDPSSMNWRNVIKKFESLGKKNDSCHSHTSEVQQIIPDKGDEYQVFRKAAMPHWDSMRSYYQRAATAYSKGERAYAAYLSDQGKLHTKMAREADEKASQQIFKARNKSIENVITIDLHGQHVEQALKLLKLHLLFGTYVSSIQSIRVITGCGLHGVGKSKLKESVIQLMKKEGIEWSEENRGSILIRLNGQREFHFLDSDCETE